MKIKENFIPVFMSVFLLIYPLRGGDALGYGFLPSLVITSIMVLVILFRQLTRRNGSGFSKVDVAVFIYFQLILISVMIAGVGSLSLDYLKQIIALSIVPYVFVRTCGFCVEDVSRFLKVFPYISVIAAGSMLLIVGPEQLISYSGNRLGTDSLNPVGVGYVFGLSALITTASIRLKQCNIIFGGISIIISIIILVLTGSRGSMIVLVASLSAFFLANKGFSARMLVTLLLASVAAYFSFGLLSETMVADRFENALDSDSARERLVYYAEAVDNFNQRPFLGFGLGAFEERNGAYVHNAVLEHLVNGGMIITLVYLFFFVYLIIVFVVTATRKRNQWINILALLGIYAFSVRLFSLSMANTKEVFLFLGMAVSCYHNELRRASLFKGHVQEDKLNR